MHSMHDATGRTMLTAIPEDILVYFTQHWLPNHAGSSTAGKELIAAPGSLSGIKSHLATEYELLGRIRNWDPATQTGNPMHSMQVKNMLKGYANHATELGYQKRGAVPLTQLEMHTMLSSMFQMFRCFTSAVCTDALPGAALLPTGHCANLCYPPCPAFLSHCCALLCLFCHQCWCCPF